MSANLAGTWQLARLALRRDRIILPLWIVVLGLTPSSSATTYNALYPTAADRASLAHGIGASPTVAVIYGPAFDLSTAGGFAAWRFGGFIALITGLMAIFTVTRHTRAEEDSGRAELLASAIVGRYAALTAAVLVSSGASVLIGLLETASLAGSKLPVAGSLAFGLATALTGITFTAIAALAVQLAEYSRTANGIGSAAVGIAFLLRAAGDSSASAHWLSWFSPIGWAQRLRPYAGERWWVALLPVGASLVFGVAGYLVLPRRDVGVGILPSRPGRAEASPSLRTPLALGWRLQRGSLIGWGIGMGVSGALFGSLTKGIGDLLGSSEQTKQIFERMGGSAALTDAYLAAMAGLFAMVAALYGVQAALRMRGEETSGRVEPLLATRVGRLRWAASHLTFAFLGSAGIMLLSGLLLGLWSGSNANMLAAVLVQIPAVWVIIGLTVTFYGVLPRFAAAGWVIGGLALAISMFGPALNAPQSILDISPFSHIPKIPGQLVTAAPLVWLTVIAAVALVAGLATFRRRDLG